MMTQKSLQFGHFTLDLERLCLKGPSGELKLRPKSFEVLRYLAEPPARVVSKDEVIAAVWPDVIVTDDSLIRCISEVRRAIDDEEAQVIVRTVSRRGYLFDASVRADTAECPEERAARSRSADSEDAASAIPA